jgi:predicted nucleotidyltransferase
MGIDEILRSKRREVLDLAAAHGATRIRVFGSVARGDAGPDSDVDLLVAMDNDRSLLDLIGLGQDLQELLGRRVDVVSERGLSAHVRNRVLAEAIAL